MTILHYSQGHTWILCENVEAGRGGWWPPYQQLHTVSRMDGEAHIFGGSLAFCPPALSRQEMNYIKWGTVEEAKGNEFPGS